MQIQKVEIENFKILRHFSFEIEDFNCLIGPNNSGKSSVLQALTIFDYCVHNCIVKKGIKYTNISKTIYPEQFYAVPMVDSLDLFTDKFGIRGRQNVEIKIKVYFDNNSIVTAKLTVSFNKLSLKLESSRNSQTFLKLLYEYNVLYLPVYSVFQVKEERRTSHTIDLELFGGRASSVIRNLLLNLRDKGRIENLLTILKRSFSEVTKLDVIFNDQTDLFIQVTYKEKGRIKSFDVFSGGSGFQQFIYLFGLILLKNPSIILLDEPDVHLHGNLIKNLIYELKEFSKKEKQILIATHSIDIYGRLSPEELIYLEENEAKKLDCSVLDVLNRLGNYNPINTAKLDKYKNVFIVENKDDEIIVSIFLENLLGLAWYPIVDKSIFLYSGGNPIFQINDIEKIYSLLSQAINVGENLKLLVIADSDYYPEIEYLTDVPNTNIKFHVWKRVEIENYLIDEDVFIKTMGIEGRREISELRRKVVEIIETSKDSARDHLLQAYDLNSKNKRNGWNIVSISQVVDSFLENHWEGNKISLCDAKDVVLPKIREWAQSKGYKTPSNIRIAKQIDVQRIEDIRRLERAIKGHFNL